MLFIFGHSLLIVGLLRNSRTSPPFAYSRGFSRDTLWAHEMLASAIAASAAWLPVALLVWCGARSVVQDRLLSNPLFPFIAPREYNVLWGWLALYGLILPALHYSWIRAAQPVRWPDSGVWLAVAIVIGVVTIWNSPRFPLRETLWFRIAIWTAGASIALCLLVAGRRLHRELEARV